MCYSDEWCCKIVTNLKSSVGYYILNALSLVFVLPLLGYISMVAYNHYTLHVFAQRFFAHPLPSETTVLSKETWYGLTGNGNHCTFEATLFVDTNLTEEEMRVYYQGITFPVIHETSRAPAIHGLEGVIPVHIRYPVEAGDHVELTVVDGPYFDWRNGYFRCS